MKHYEKLSFQPNYEYFNHDIATDVGWDSIYPGLLWPPDAKSDSAKDPDAGKDWRQKEKGMVEDEMVR